MNYQKATILVVVAALLTLQMPLAGAGSTVPPGDPLSRLAHVLNIEDTGTLRLTKPNEVTCGEGCGECHADIDCEDNQVAECSCANTGNTCWSWFHKKAVFTCNCACVQKTTPPPTKPPQSICVKGLPTGEICVTEG